MTDNAKHDGKRVDRDGKSNRVDDATRNLFNGSEAAEDETRDVVNGKRDKHGETFDLSELDFDSFGVSSRAGRISIHSQADRVNGHRTDTKDMLEKPIGSETGTAKTKKLVTTSRTAIAIAAIGVVALLAMVLVGMKGLVSSSVDDPSTGSPSTAESLLPDKALRKIILSKCDSNQDGKLDAKELEDVEQLDLSKSKVKSLKGIEAFSNLRFLDLSDCNRLTEINVSELQQLESMKLEGTNIKSLDLSSNSHLTELKVDDSVKLEGMDSTSLREQWQISSYSQEGYAGDDPQRRGTWTETFKYNDDNTLSARKITGRDVDGQPIDLSAQFFYDSNGELNHYKEVSNGSVQKEVSLFRDDNSCTIEERAPSGEYLKSSRCLYDKDGSVVEVDKPDIDLKSFYEYGDDGSLSEVRYEDGSKSYSNVYRYSSGQLQSVDCYGYSGGSGFRYSYDDEGRCIRRELVDSTGHEVVSSAEYSYDSDGLLRCDKVDLEYDENGNLVGRSFRGSSGQIGKSKISYRRVITPKDSENVFQPLALGDPALAPLEILPCAINLMEGKDPIAERNGPYVLRTT